MGCSVSSSSATLGTAASTSMRRHRSAPRPWHRPRLPPGRRQGPDHPCGTVPAVDRVRPLVADGGRQHRLLELRWSRQAAGMGGANAIDTSLLFLDFSRNHSRRWCSMNGCGARAKMRRYRAGRSR
ncbi:MAG: hypothetical protein GEV10_10045 [Streptosporangiales bacterium]|nr:hypothetical protein [Streptosporangiales bacterium]